MIVVSWAIRINYNIWITHKSSEVYHPIFWGQLIAIQSVRFMIYKNVPEVHYKINTVEGFPMKKINDYDISPCDVIFSMVEKPKDYLMCKSMNVYDDRWRVNIYSKRYVNDIEGKYISKSYFVHFNKSNGNISFVPPNI